MQDYDKIPVDDGDGAGAGARQQPTKKESRPIAWARKHFNDCCGCVGDCVACPIKWALGIFLPIIVILIIIIIVLAIVLPKMGIDPVQVMETGEEMVTAITGGGKGKTTHRLVSSSLLDSPWFPSSPDLPSLDGSIDMPPSSNLAINLTWAGIDTARDLKAVAIVALRRSTAAIDTLGGLPLPASLTPGAHSWPCTALSGLCASVTTAWSNGDIVYVVLLNSPPPATSSNVIDTGLVY